jgi:sterol 14-demethylase
LTYDTLQTPILNAFIKEILRLHPPLHSLMRKIISDCPVPTSVGSPSANPSLSASERKRLEGVEYVVPKDTYVLAAPGCSMIDEEIWGKDSREFDEKRWLGANGSVPGDEDEGEEDYG